MTDEITVLYIARGIGAGLPAAQAFASAWAAQPPGSPCSLVFLAKGWPDPATRQELKEPVARCQARVIDLPDAGLDWGAYFAALDHVHSPWLCLMNSHARPLAAGWLRLLLDAARGPGHGIAGATGSWESPRQRPAAGAGLGANVLHGLRSLRHWHAWRGFPGFPNPHLRSNGLVIRRDLLASFASRHGAPASKWDALRLESGDQGLGPHVVGQGARLVVAGRDGQTWTSDGWPASGTFRSGTQDNLLIGDNRTRDFDNATPAERNRLARLAWGQASHA